MFLDDETGTPWSYSHLVFLMKLSQRLSSTVGSAEPASHHWIRTKKYIIYQIYVSENRIRGPRSISRSDRVFDLVMIICEVAPSKHHPTYTYRYDIKKRLQRPTCVVTYYFSWKEEKGVLLGVYAVSASLSTTFCRCKSFLE